MSGPNGKWQCPVCGEIYDEALGDPEAGAPPGTRFETLPAGWLCPACGAAHDSFAPYAP